MMKRHFAQDMTTSRVFEALAFLIESGSVYSALLVIFALHRPFTNKKLAHSKTQIFVIVYQAASETSPIDSLVMVAADFFYGCFVPLTVSRRLHCHVRPGLLVLIYYPVRPFIPQSL